MAAPVTAVGAFRRVLVGFDGSPDAAAAIRAATAVAARDGGHVVALSVVRRVPHPDGDDSQDGDGGHLRTLAEGVFSDVRRELPATSAVRMSAQVIYADRDNPAQAVTEYAVQHGFDILVLGRHGDGRRWKSRLGRVADRAVHECSVPVLLLGGV
jgi:nucleotide-binding universal stress UspA family protein